jgi:diaminopimelate decarboxylase
MISEEPISFNLLPKNSSISDSGRLEISGVDLIDLADEFGTPLFVYDEASIISKVHEMREAFDGEIYYASKAFTCRYLAELLSSLGVGLDVASLGELAVAERAKFPGDKIVFHGNNKSSLELTKAIDYKVHRIVVDSFQEIDKLSNITSVKLSHSERVKVYLRINQGISAGAHDAVNTGQLDSKFGFIIEPDAIEAAKKIRQTVNLDLAGLHFHLGSQIFDLSVYEKALTKIAPLIDQLEIREISVGGGLGVSYKTGDPEISVSRWAKALRQGATKAGISEEIPISIEPGRSLIANAAITLYKVGVIKEVPGVRTYVAVDGGMSDNPRPLMYSSGYEAFLPRAVSEKRPLAARIVGKHCESGDILVEDARLPNDLEVGDILATPVTGAYGYSMASNYNKVPRPAVVFLSNGEARTVIRRETIKDLISLDL